MEQLFLMPGEERYERFKDGNGVPKVHYSSALCAVHSLTARAAVLRKPSACAKTGLWGRIAATATNIEP